LLRSNNIGIKSAYLDALETALKNNNDEDVAFNVMQVFILVIHEGSHWARAMKVQKPESSDWCYEMGARGEEAFFDGVRFHYSKCMSADLLKQAADDKKVKKYSDGLVAFFKFFSNTSLSSTIKKMKTPKGQEGDPVVKEAKIFVQKGTYETENKKSKGTDYSY
jgi:hypothetical protein